MYLPFENMAVSIVHPRYTQLLACVYFPQDHVAAIFFGEFKSFVGFLSSIHCMYYVCCDFNITVYTPVGDSYKFMAFLDSCDLRQLVNLSICMVTHFTTVYLQ